MRTVCLKDLEQCTNKGAEMSSHSFSFLRNGRRPEYDLLGWQICFKITPWHRYVHFSTPTEYTHLNADLKYSSIYLGSSFELRSPYQSKFFFFFRMIMMAVSYSVVRLWRFDTFSLLTLIVIFAKKPETAVMIITAVPPSLVYMHSNIAKLQ